MALSQAYLEWERQTERRGQEQGEVRGREQERQAAIRSLMQLRYGTIDDILESLMPQLSALSSEEYTRLLLELSREDLIAHFGKDAKYRVFGSSIVADCLSLIHTLCMHTQNNMHT